MKGRRDDIADKSDDDNGKEELARLADETAHATALQYL